MFNRVGGALIQLTSIRSYHLLAWVPSCVASVIQKANVVGDQAHVKGGDFHFTPIVCTKKMNIGKFLVDLYYSPATTLHNFTHFTFTTV
jgi:hypothetical protein